MTGDIREQATVFFFVEAAKIIIALVIRIASSAITDHINEEKQWQGCLLATKNSKITDKEGFRVENFKAYGRRNYIETFRGKHDEKLWEF